MIEGKTKDEKYVLALYKMALEQGDPQAAINRYAVGASIGLQQRGIDNTCKLLAQANFIKKAEEEDIYLTPVGLDLVKRLQGK